MASTASAEASEIRRRGRQRLIGAIALVMLLVVFVPMVLDSEPRPSHPVAPIPPRDNAPALPAPPKAVAPSKEAVPPAQAGAQSPAPDAASAKPAPAPPALVSPKASPKLEGFAVQVGAFRDEAKLKQARDKVAAANVVHYTERLEAQGGPLTRLRAGPFPTRESAEAAQAALKLTGLEAKVVPLP
jgi:DedD protein